MRDPRRRRVVVEATSTGWWYFAAVGEARCVCMLVTDPRIYVRSGKNLHDWWRSELRETAQVRLHYAEYARTDRCSFAPRSRGDSTRSMAPAGWRSETRR